MKRGVVETVIIESNFSVLNEIMHKPVMFLKVVSDSVLGLFIVSVFLLGSCTGSKENNQEAEHQEGQLNTGAAVVSLGELGIDETTTVPDGLPQGGKSPGFAARDINNVPFDLYSVLLDGPVVLVFYRGKWSPECITYLANLADSANLIKSKGATLVAVTPELKNNALETAGRTKADFHIISDPGNNISNVFKVAYDVTDQYIKGIEEKHGVNIAANNGSEKARLPITATFIIGQQGDLNYVHFDRNFRNRATVAEILKYL